MSKFKSGDIVVLKSGNSPEMTVKETCNIDNNPNECLVLCTWFDGKKVTEHEFHEAQLKIHESTDFSKLGKEH